MHACACVFELVLIAICRIIISISISISITQYAPCTVEQCMASLDWVLLGTLSEERNNKIRGQSSKQISKPMK